MPTSPIPNWDEALLAEPLPAAAFVPVFELVWLSSPHAARSSANAPAPPAPTIFRNFLRDAGSASIRRTALFRGFGSSIGDLHGGYLLPVVCEVGARTGSGRAAGWHRRTRLLVAQPGRWDLRFGRGTTRGGR